MIKLVKRNPSNAASKAKLAERVAYISDSTHKDHLAKTILPARNYNCPDPSGDSFISEVIRLDAEYRNSREGRRGKRSARLFEEVIYSSPHGANLNDLERESVESMIVNLVGRTTACRTAWHLDNDTGRADLHVFLAAKNRDYPPRVTLWADYGGNEGKHVFAEFDRLDVAITRHINKAPDRKIKLKSAEQVRKEKASKATGTKPSLAAEIAAKVSTAVTMDNVSVAIAKLGHTVTKVTAKSVSIVFAGKTKPRRYNLANLLVGIAAEQELSREHRPNRHPRPVK